MIINSDCLEVIQTMHDGGILATEASAIYEECIFLARGFDHVIFEHCNREVNIVVHFLVVRLEGDQTCVWTGDPPDFIISSSINDVTLFEHQ
jgi:hypothetical protein